MAVFRSFHLKDNTIAMIPKYGYVNNSTYSADAIRWLDYTAHINGLEIKHALNGLGEVKVDNYSVDGFCETTNTIYQYHVSV